MELQQQETEISLERGGEKRGVQEQGKEEDGGGGMSNKGPDGRCGGVQAKMLFGSQGW